MPEVGDGISVKDAILKIRFSIEIIKRKWVLVIFISLVGGILGAIIAMVNKPKYTATLTFVLSTEQKTGMLAGIAGQFGFDLGGSNDGAFSGDNIMELFRSRRMIKRALFSKTEDGTLLQAIAKESGKMNGWEKNQRISRYLPFPDTETELTSIQDSLVNDLYDLIVNKDLNVDKKDKKLSFYSVSTTTKMPQLSVAFTKCLVNVTAKFYIETKTQTASQNLKMLQHEADSIQDLLKSSIISSAETIDKTYNLNPTLQVQRSGVQQNQAKASAYGVTYGEIVKNLEMAKMNLQSETPIFQIIDEPENGVKMEKMSKLKSFVIGGFLSFVLICGFILFGFYIQSLDK